MKFGWKLRRKQPISLKWKWGVLLFLGFFMIALLTLNVYHYQNTAFQKEVMSTIYQDEYRSSVDYLQTFDTFYQVQNYSSLDDDMQALADVSEMIAPNLHDYLSTKANDEIVIRLYNHNNKLMYTNRHVVVPSIELSSQLLEQKDHGKYRWVGKSAIHSTIDGKFLGTIEFIVEPKKLQQLEHQQLRFLSLSMLLLAIISALIAWVVSRQFLRPLNYLNNTLDLVEEESLSQMRMRKPRTSDEWSDLTLHINRMLDKIDLYVKNQKQFVEDVSHELRTPVAIVEGHLTMLNRWGKNDPAVLEESIAASLQEISRMKGLVQEMLDLMRADHAEIDYKDEVTEVNATVRQVYNNFVMLYSDFKFYLDIDKNSDEQYIKMFRNHFEQVLIILMDNAVKYSTNRQEIHLSVSTSFSEIEIAVQDFGEGMTDEDKTRIFSRFYRVDKARSRDKGGNGLGLSIAQQLVQSYKGTIKVESVLGHGSIFYVSFPILSDTRQIYKSKQIAKEKSI